MRILRCRSHLTAACKLPRPLRWEAACALKPAARFQSAARAALDAPPHTPVLLPQVLGAFKGTELKVHVDCTLGAGGHAEAIIKNHPELEHFVGIDQDATALEIAQQRLEQFSARGVQLHYVHSNFRPLLQHIQTLIDQENIPYAPDGILMDLGVSSMQLDQAERGFSFLKEGPLDMRMDPRSTATAETLVNELSEQELGKIIREYGEERMWRTVARRIVDARGQERISTTTQLASIIGRTRISSKGSKKRSAANRGPHPATRTFQALRIAVNAELQVIEEVVPQAIEALRPQGRLAVISFHSLEDKIVKWAMREAAGQGKTNAEHGDLDMLRARGLDATELDAVNGRVRQDRAVRLIGRRAVTATDKEVEENARARSAKLRVVEKF